MRRLGTGRCTRIFARSHVLVANRTFMLLWAWSSVDPCFQHHVYQPDLAVAKIKGNGDRKLYQIDIMGWMSWINPQLEDCCWNVWSELHPGCCSGVGNLGCLIPTEMCSSNSTWISAHLRQVQQPNLFGTFPHLAGSWLLSNISHMWYVHNLRVSFWLPRLFAYLNSSEVVSLPTDISGERREESIYRFILGWIVIP